uniref:Uncharacterized protein n=1 Tax=Arundo donax TaxID=35708 RepID=A0A0A9C6F9_ARUDO
MHSAVRHYKFTTISLLFFIIKLQL